MSLTEKPLPRELAEEAAHMEARRREIIERCRRRHEDRIRREEARLADRRQ